MGGSISGGNVNGSAEANIYNDPEAAEIVFQAGWPLTMVGLDVGDKTLLSSKHLSPTRTDPRTDERFYLPGSEVFGGPFGAIWLRWHADV